MNLSMFFHEYLAVLVVCTLGGWAPLFERSWCNRARALAPWVLLVLVFGDHFR